MSDINRITAAIIDAAVRIHKKLGLGLLESVYERVLAYELERAGFKVERQKKIDIRYEELVIEDGFSADLLVDETVVVELKSAEKVVKVNFKQTLTYLRLMELQVGLLLNFGEVLMKDGIHRIVNGYEE